MNELKFYIKRGFNVYELQHSPDGWDDGILEIERSTNYLGIVRSYSIKLKFMLDGAAILRDIFYNRIQQPATLIIKKLNRLSLSYEDLFSGVFDFSTFIDSEYSVEVSILDNNFSDYVKKNLDKKYTLTLTTNTNFYFRQAPGNTAFRATQYVYFNTVLWALIDQVTEGKLSSGEYDLNTNAIITSSDIKRVITNSVALQGGQLATIVMSLKDMFQSLFVLFKVSPSIRVIDGVQTMTLVPIADTFPEVASFEIDKVNDFKLSFAKDFLFDTISIGYPTQEVESEVHNDLGVTSLNEFGVTSKYGNPSAIPVNKELDLTTKLRSDNTGIMEYSGQYGYPDSSQNESFVVVIKRDSISGNYMIDEGFASHVDYYTFWQPAWNVRISPKRLLLEHEQYVNSCFYGLSGNVNFLSGPGSINLRGTATDLTGWPVSADVENEQYGYIRSKDPYFLPVNFDFEALLPDAITYNGTEYPFNFNYLSVPYLLRFRFKYKNTWYEGFLMSMKVNVSGRKNKAVIKLLATPNNDLSKLIR